MKIDICIEDMREHNVTLEAAVIVFADVLNAYCPMGRTDRPETITTPFGSFSTRELKKGRDINKETLLKERAALVFIRETLEHYRTDVTARGKLKSWVKLMDEVIAKVDKVMGTEPRASA